MVLRYTVSAALWISILFCPAAVSGQSLDTGVDLINSLRLPVSEQRDFRSARTDWDERRILPSIEGMGKKGKGASPEVWGTVTGAGAGLVVALIFNEPGGEAFIFLGAVVGLGVGSFVEDRQEDQDQMVAFE